MWLAQVAGLGEICPGSCGVFFSCFFVTGQTLMCSSISEKSDSVWAVTLTMQTVAGG